METQDAMPRMEPGTPQAGWAQTTPEPPRSFITTWLLSLLLGWAGVDRFYLGKVGTGLFKLFTFAGFGLWYLVDLILVLTGVQTDRNGQRLDGYQEHRRLAWWLTGTPVVLWVLFNLVVVVWAFVLEWFDSVLSALGL